MSIPDKSRSSLMPMIMPPPGKKMLPTRAQATALEEALLGGLDPDKLNDLSEVLFALNAHKLGPIPGFYVVVCTKPDEEWCVGQLAADRAKPLIMFEDMRFDKPEAALTAAETAQGRGRRCGQKPHRHRLMQSDPAQAPDRR